MFTGIITDIGRIQSCNGRANGKRFVIETSYDTESIDIGASISCSGVCLTVVDKDEDSFSVDASEETLSRTTASGWKEGVAINLERALKAGDELGGHIVSGHVDSVINVAKVEDIGDNKKITFEAPSDFMKFIAEKGSVCLDGISLTVNGVSKDTFWVNIIPHSLETTTFSDLKEGDKVNLEIDTIARYSERLLETKIGS